MSCLWKFRQMSNFYKILLAYEFAIFGTFLHLLLSKNLTMYLFTHLNPIKNLNNYYHKSSYQNGEQCLINVVFWQIFANSLYHISCQLSKSMLYNLILSLQILLIYRTFPYSLLLSICTALSMTWIDGSENWKRIFLSLLNIFVPDKNRNYSPSWKTFWPFLLAEKAIKFLFSCVFNARLSSSKRT